MSDHAELERLALRVAELSGELSARIETGAEYPERRAVLDELRRQLEALESQATLIAVEMNRERG